MRRRLYGGGEGEDPATEEDNEAEKALWIRGNRGQEDNKAEELEKACPSPSPAPPTSPTNEGGEDKALAKYLIEDELEGEKPLPAEGDVQEDNAGEPLEKALEELLENDKEGLEALETQHSKQELVPKPADAPVTPRKQGRLYEFVGLKSPDPDTKILEAIEALPKGARPTKEMFAYWGRQGAEKKKNNSPAKLGDQHDRRARKSAASVLLKRRWQPNRQERLHMCKVMEKERKHYKITTTKEENAYWQDMLQEIPRAKNVKKLKKIWKGREADWIL